MFDEFYSGILFFDLRFRGDLVHLLLYLRVTSVFLFLLFCESGQLIIIIIIIIIMFTSYLEFLKQYLKQHQQ